MTAVHQFPVAVTGPTICWNFQIGPYSLTQLIALKRQVHSSRRFGRLLMNFRRLWLVVWMAMGIVAVAGTLLAHHSFAMFDTTKSMTLTGTVTKFEWTNPHAYI